MALTRHGGTAQADRLAADPYDDFAAREGAPGWLIAPRIGVFDAVRRHWFVALVPIITIVGVAVAVGLVRRPTYTATTSVSVGQLAMTNVAQLPGIVDATVTLAASYSRSITAESVTRDAARRIHTTPAAVAAHVSATPVPQSPLIKVSGTGASVASAVAYSRGASTALVSYLRRLAAASSSGGQLFARFQRAALAYSKRLHEELALKRRAGRTPNASEQANINDAEARTQAARLRREGLRIAYQDTQQAASATIPVQVATPAAGASSDRLSKLQLLIFVGLLAGLASGAALATLRANHLARRLLR